MGSGTALGMAAMHPDAVAKLIAVDGGPEVDPRGLARVADAFAALPSTFDTIEEAMKFHSALLPGVSTDELRHYVEPNLIRDDDGKLRLKTDPELIRAFVHNHSEDDPDAASPFWQALESIRCPTLIVRGSTSDILSRTCAERMLGVIADARLVEVDAGHAVPLENPSAFLAAVQSFV